MTGINTHLIFNPIGNEHNKVPSTYTIPLFPENMLNKSKFINFFLKIISLL